MHQTESKKRLLLAIILLGSAVLGYLHIKIQPITPEKDLRSVSEIDTAIETVLRRHLLADQTEKTVIHADSLLERAFYRVEVPASFSKTTFHMDLQRLLAPFQVTIFGEVTFPSEDMRLEITYNRTLFRTIELIEISGDVERLEGS